MTLARTTLKYGDVYFRAIASRMVRSVFVSVIEYGLVRGIKTPIGAHPYCQSALSKQDNTSYYLCQCVLSKDIIESSERTRWESCVDFSQPRPGSELPRSPDNEGFGSGRH